jgi:hypothetical protein
VAPPAVLGMSQVRAAFLDDLSTPEEGEATRACQTTRIGYLSGAETGVGCICPLPREAWMTTEGVVP